MRYRFAIIGLLAFLFGSVRAQACDGRYVRLELAGNFLHVAEVEVLSGGTNVALRKTATQSSVYNNAVPERAVDGNTNGDWNAGSVMGTQNSNEWWEVDLGQAFPIQAIIIYNRTDNPGIAQPRLRGAMLKVLAADRQLVWQETIETGHAQYRIELEPDNTMKNILATNKFMLAAPAPIKSVVFHGDSITADGRWAALFKAKVEKAQNAPVTNCRNLAVGGTGAIQQRKSGATIAAANPDLVCVMLGLNDMRQGIPVAQYRAALEEIVGAIRVKCPAALVILGGPTLLPEYVVPTTDGKPYANGRYDRGNRALHLAYRDELKALAAKYQCAFADVYAAMEAHPEIKFDSYKTHPDNRGHEVIADCFFQTYQAAKSAVAPAP
jgi:lysophospholipase L1-like esterase